MSTENQKPTPDDFSDLIPRFMELFEIIHARCPLAEKYAQLTLNASGYSQRNCSIDAYYGDILGVHRAKSVPELLAQISQLDPEQAKKDRIAKLKAELQELEQPEKEQQ